MRHADLELCLHCRRRIVKLWVHKLLKRPNQPAFIKVVVVVVKLFS